MTQAPTGAPAVASDELVASLQRLGLVGRRLPPMRPLAGGVSSEVWMVELASGPVCVKRALPRLNVAARWEAPVERTRFEVAWLEIADAIVPGIAPRLLAHDDGAVVMAYLDPVVQPVWKFELRDGRVAPAFAAALGASIGRLHAAAAARPWIASRFDDGTVFAAMRLDPYLGAVAGVHPDLAGILAAIRASYEAHRVALLHGDVSPKNVLVGRRGPILLDSECATWGDPAFDVGFCASHLLLKCRWNKAATPRLLEAFDALVGAYRPYVVWEPWDAVEARAVHMAAACLLARVDGLSPVEYLDGAERAGTRAVARRLLSDGVSKWDELRAVWRAGLAA